MNQLIDFWWFLFFDIASDNVFIVMLALLQIMVISLYIIFIFWTLISAEKSKGLPEECYDYLKKLGYKRGVITMTLLATLLYIGLNILFLPIAPILVLIVWLIHEDFINVE